MKGTSAFKGVSYNKEIRKWEAIIIVNKKKYPCGYFDDEIEAALAADRKAWELCGPYACLNSPDRRPQAGKSEILNPKSETNPNQKGTKAKAKPQRTQRMEDAHRCKQRNPKQNRRNALRAKLHGRGTNDQSSIINAEAPEVVAVSFLLRELRASVVNHGLTQRRRGDEQIVNHHLSIVNAKAHA